MIMKEGLRILLLSLCFIQCANFDPPPKIIESYPDQNEALFSNEQAMYVTFNQPMNQLLTEQSFQIYGSQVAMIDYRWQGTTLYPQIRKPLAIGRDYQMIIRSHAESQSGIPLDQDYIVSFAYQTRATSPHVIASDPVDHALFIPSSKVISLFFDQNMDQESVESAFTIQPKITGEFAWPNPRQMTFQPINALPAAIYTIALQSTARSLDQIMLPEVFRSNFQVGKSLSALQIEKIQILNRISNTQFTEIATEGGEHHEIPKESYFQITFNQPIVEDSIRHGIQIFDQNSQRSLPYTLLLLDHQTKIEIKPIESFHPQRQIHLTLPEMIIAQESRLPLSHAAIKKWHFKIANSSSIMQPFDFLILHKVEKILPDPIEAFQTPLINHPHGLQIEQINGDSMTLRLCFNAPIDLASALASIRLSYLIGADRPRGAITNLRATTTSDDPHCLEVRIERLANNHYVLQLIGQKEGLRSQLVSQDHAPIFLAQNINIYFRPQN